MFVNVSFVNLSSTIYVKHGLWNRESELRTVIDHMSDNWSIGKVYIGNKQITESDLSQKLSTFVSGYDIQIEQRK